MSTTGSNVFRWSVHATKISVTILTLFISNSKQFLVPDVLKKKTKTKAPNCVSIFLDP